MDAALLQQAALAVLGALISGIGLSSVSYLRKLNETVARNDERDKLRDDREVERDAFLHELAELVQECRISIATTASNNATVMEALESRVSRVDDRVDRLESGSWKN